MKKLLFLLLSAMAVGGCSQFEEQDAAPSRTVSAPMTLEASVEAPEAGTRTYIDSSNMLHWTANDEISYFPGVAYNVQYRFNGETGDTGGSFQKLMLDPVTGLDLACNYAVYPYRESNKVAVDGTITVTLPATQTYAEGSFGRGANVMVAATKDVDDAVLRFKNVGGYLKLQLYGVNAKVQSVTLRGNNNEKIAGEASISALYGEDPEIEMSESALTTITIDCSAGGGVSISENSAKPTTFWFVLPEVTFTKGFTVTAQGVDGGTYTRSTSNSVAIERNMIQPMAALKVTLGGEGIDVVNNKVRFYLSEKAGSTRTATALAARNWSTSSIKVNGTAYTIQSPAENPYVEVAVAEDNVYTAVLETSTSSSRYGSNAYTDLKLPYSQFQNTVEGIITSFPMYASYTPANGNKLIFNDGFALINVKLKGTAKISSVRVENPAETVVAGISNADAATGKFTVTKGMDFAALNCTNQGAFTPLNTSTATNFYVMVAPGNYTQGLKVSICDSEHGAMFYTIPAINLEAGQVYTISKEYACESDLVFYEGFDNFVWGGDPIKGSAGYGFAPTSESVGISSHLDRTGYEEAFAQVAYNVAGSSFVQSDTWGDVSSKTVATSHQVTDSYLDSRNIRDWIMLFRVQEFPGYIGSGISSGRGFLRLPILANMKGVGDVVLKINFALKNGFTDTFEISALYGGVITGAKVNGQTLSLTTSNLKYSNETSKAAPVNMSGKIFIPSSATVANQWNDLEVTISGATDGTRLIFNKTLTSGVQGIYIDKIEVRETNNWSDVKNLRVLYWNIQNGMITDQHNDYNNFVAWVKKYDPDICIWCESETIYKDKSGTATSSKFLPDGWTQLCTRYGHTYAAVGGNRDNYPQTITSKYPIKTVQRITDTDQSGKPVSHGAGHFQITIQGKKINFVTLHMWPQSYGYGVTGDENRNTSTANNEGDYYRQFEMQYIVNNTVNKSTYASEEYWILGGDTNSRSRRDDWSIKYSTTNPTKLITHDVVLNQTDLKDVIADRDCYGEKNNVMFRSRIDVLYASPKMFNAITNSVMLMDNWCGPTSKWSYYTSFVNPSDHTPVLVDFDMSKVQ